MKSYRSTENLKNREEILKNKYNEHKTYSPTNRNLQTRLTQYESLARKAKEQLKQLDVKRKNSPENGKYQVLTQQNTKSKPFPVKEPGNSKTPTNLHHNYSYKYFKKDNRTDDTKQQHKQLKFKPQHQQYRSDKHSGDGKMESPKKKNFIDSNQYKKLHQKLDVIENKITDMKKNLQKKKQEKQKNVENKKKNEELNQNQKKISLKGLVTQVPQLAQLHTFNTNPYSPRHNVYYVSELVRAYKDQKSLAREHLITSLNILKMLQKSKKMSEQQIKKNMISLPRKKGHQDKKTIIFDLDETLIHCNDALNCHHDVKLPIRFPNGELVEAGINIRPNAKEILKNLSRYFQIIVFTASHSCYANVVIDYLDPNRQWVHHRLFREHCFLSAQGFYIKDLRIINRDLRDVVLVDNAAYSYAFQLQNGIPILPYYHGQIDFQLKMLEDYLMKLIFCKDLRESNDKIFKLTSYKHYYTKPEKLVEDLYLNK